MPENAIDWLSAHSLQLLLAAAVVAAWWLLRSKPTPLGGEGLDSLLAGGRPVVVELFDNG